MTEYSEGYLDCAEEARDAIENAPTVDAVPVRHARNLCAEYPTLFECSECGYYNNDTLPGGTDTFNYCPSCGAQMD